MGSALDTVLLSLMVLQGVYKDAAWAESECTFAPAATMWWLAWSTSAQHWVNSPAPVPSTKVAPDHLNYMILQDHTGAFLFSSARESSLLYMVVDLFLAFPLPVSLTSSAVKSSCELHQVIPLWQIAIAEQLPFELFLHDKNPFWFDQGKSSTCPQTGCFKTQVMEVLYIRNHEVCTQFCGVVEFIVCYYFQMCETERPLRCIRSTCGDS